MTPFFSMWLSRFLRTIGWGSPPFSIGLEQPAHLDSQEERQMTLPAYFLEISFFLPVDLIVIS